MIFFNKQPQIITLTVFFFLILTWLLSSIYKHDVEIEISSPVDIYDIGDSIEATAGIIYDLDRERVIAGKNINTPLPIASITKLISSHLINKYIDSDDIVSLNEIDFQLFRNTTLRMKENWNALSLLQFSLITSSNRGISALSRLVETRTKRRMIDLMKEFSVSNVLVQTHFLNETGLDAHAFLSGAESSVLDLAKFSKLFLNQNKALARFTSLETETFYSLIGRTYLANNTNKLLKEVEELNEVLLSKTGFTDIAGGSLLMVLTLKNGKTYSYVILGSKKNSRFTDMKTLIELSKKI